MGWRFVVGEVGAFRFRRPLAAPALAAIVGVLTAYFAETGPAWTAALAGVAVSTQVLRRSYWMAVVAVGFGFAAYTAVLVSHHRALPPLAELRPGDGILVVAEGVVDSEPKTGGPDAERALCFVTLDGIAREGGRTQPASQRIHARVAAGDLRYGDRIRMRGVLRLPDVPSNPGEFDFARYLALQGAHAEIDGTDPARLTLLERDQGNPLMALALRCREWIADAITTGLREDDPDVAGVITAMVLGTRGDAPDDIMENFRLSGTMHLFAVSGLHVGMIGLILWELLKLLRFPRRLVAVLVIGCLIGYAFVTGLRPSAVRAAIMASVVLLGIIADRPARLVNSLGAAALIILLFDPLQALGPGFQLSFLVLLAISGLSDVLQKPILPLISHDPFIPEALVSPRRLRVYSTLRKITGSVCVSLAAWLGSLPLMIYYFHLATPIAVVTNLILVPLAFVVIFGAVLSVLMSAVSLNGLGLILNNANFALVKLISVIIAGAAAVPGGHFFVATQPEILAPPCQIHVLDIPRGGGAAHVRTHDGAHWLIDCGGYRDFERTMLPFLRALGANTLDGLLLTHSDSRHIGGANRIIEELGPARVHSQIEHRRATAIRNMASPPANARAGTVFPVGSNGTLRVLFPPEGHDAALADDRAMVFQLRFGNWRVLLVGDAGYETENWLMENVMPADLESDVLVMGRHATDHTGQIAFIESVRPDAIVATSADFPPEEKLPSAWRESIEERGLAVFDQGESGCVRIDLEEGELTISSFVGERIHTLRKRAR